MNLTRRSSGCAGRNDDFSDASGGRLEEVLVEYGKSKVLRVKSKFVYAEAAVAFLEAKDGVRSAPTGCESVACPRSVRSSALRVVVGFSCAFTGRDGSGRFP
jgi:hypothetical protein